MEREHSGVDSLVTGIHLDLVTRAVTFDVEGRPALTLRLTPYGLTLEGEVPSPLSGEAPLEEAAQRTITLSGRLKTAPKPGRADRSGNPTTYARLAAHVEGEAQAHDYICTFHRHTAPVALRLRKEDPVTVEGYVHESQAANRLDTFSVVNLLQYPGMPEQRRRHPGSAR